MVSSFPSRPAGKSYPGYTRELFTREHIEKSFDILRCFSSFSPRSTMASRFLENLSFGITSGLALLISPAPDVVYANTWPILAQGIIGLICKIRRIPIIISVQDIYPETLLVQKRIKNDHSWIFRLLRWMDALITRNSAAVIVISSQFRELYLQDRKLLPEKIYVVPNWIDESELAVNPTNNPIRSKYNIPDNAFLVVYGGNIGKAAGVDNVIKAFAEMIEYEEIYLLIAGDGTEFDYCQRLAGESKNNRIVFHRPWPADETSTVLGAADIFVLPTQGEQSLVSVPSKLLSYMLASRPVVALAYQDSEVAKMIQNSGCGWITPPDASRNLAKLIIEISRLPDIELTRCGKAGRAFVLERYSKDANLHKIITIVEGAGHSATYTTANMEIEP